MTGMAKTDPIGIRLDLAERDALTRAALADDRSVSALARKIIVAWLAQNGWLRADQPAQRKARRPQS